MITAEALIMAVRNGEGCMMIIFYYTQLIEGTRHF